MSKDQSLITRKALEEMAKAACYESEESQLTGRMPELSDHELEEFIEERLEDSAPPILLTEVA